MDFDFACRSVFFFIVTRSGTWAFLDGSFLLHLPQNVQECVSTWRALASPSATFTESVLGGCGHNAHLEAWRGR